MRVVEDAVADGVGEVRVADAGVPVLGRELAGDERRDALGAVLDHLDEISSFGVAKGCEQPVVDRKEVEAGEAVEDAGVGAVAALRWRTGCEGRISALKRRHGLRRCRDRGTAGMERWVGLGVIANNLLVLGRAAA